MDQLITNKGEEESNEPPPPPYEEINPFEYLSNFPEKDIIALKKRIRQILAMTTEEQGKALKDFETEAYNMGYSEQVKNVINYYVKKYNKDYSTKTDDAVSTEYKKFTDYSSFRMKAIVKGLKNLEKSSLSDEAIKLDRDKLTKEAINILMDLTLLTSRLGKIKLTDSESKIYNNVSKNPQYKAKAHKLHSFSSMDPHEFKIIYNKLLANNVEMFLEKDKAAFINRKTGATVTKKQLESILQS